MTVLSTRFKAACSALVAGLPGLALGFALGVTGLGGVFSIRRNTSSSEGSLDTDDIPQQVLMDLYAVTGELVINWGIFEASLNMIVNLVYRDFGGQYVTGESEPIPVPFTRRLNFLKTCFKKIPALASFRENERTLRGGQRTQLC